MIGDHINGRTFDDPVFNPLWATGGTAGAMFLIHQGGDTVVSGRLNRYHLPNTIGNLADRAVTFASFVFGGVMDRYPNLKVCLCHGGGYACYGIGRMDRGWHGAPGGAAAHAAGAQRVPEPLLLRLPDAQRGRLADAD